MAAAAYQQQQQGAPHLGLGYTAAIEGSTSLGSSYGTARHEQGQHELGPSAGGQFGVLELTDVPRQQQQQPGQEQQQEEGAGLAEAPPDLATWRARLFDVGSRGETLVLSSAEYATYFPHVDNVYSHRSTQRYKRRSFVSHYWDCRMKGRPSGTAPGAGDPNRRKRKRAVRERDLCDVKIKIVEYAGGARVALGEGHVLFSLAAAVPGPQGGGKELQVAPGDTVWTIQRVNGNGGNGRAGGVAGPHRHTLQQSDAIKRNSVQRMQARREREAKKTQVRGLASSGGNVC